jgi:hypothetical protein
MPKIINAHNLEDRSAGVVGLWQTCAIFGLCAAVALVRRADLTAASFALSAVALAVVARLTRIRVPASTRFGFVVFAVGLMAIVWFGTANHR